MLRKSHVGSVRPEAPKPVGNPDDGDSTSQFLVLYYKRKNKVHKAKGVSKMDGVLKLTANGNIVCMTTPTGEPVVAPRRDTDISLDLNENDVLTVGAYEVEIVARVGGSSSSTSPCNGPLHGSTRSLLTKKDLGASMKPLVPRKPLLSHQVGPVSTGSTSNSAISRTGFAKKEAPKRHFLLPPKQRLPLAEKPLVASGPRSFVKRALVPLLNRTSTSNQSTAATGVSFPGAVGTIDVPHSIRIALKPHQRTGLVFLWNCLHLRPEDQPYRGGAILADEMGLGKTLMTIATICALYRQQRNKVRGTNFRCPTYCLPANQLDKHPIMIRNTLWCAHLRWFQTGPKNLISGLVPPANLSASSSRKAVTKGSIKSKSLGKTTTVITLS